MCMKPDTAGLDGPICPAYSHLALQPCASKHGWGGMIGHEWSWSAHGVMLGTPQLMLSYPPVAIPRVHLQTHSELQLVLIAYRVCLNGCRGAVADEKHRASFAIW